jgi:hypothetical protein
LAKLVARLFLLQGLPAFQLLAKMFSRYTCFEVLIPDFLRHHFDYNSFSTNNVDLEEKMNIYHHVCLPYATSSKNVVIG